MGWVEIDGVDTNLDDEDEDSLGPDSDMLLKCGCVVAINHGHWDWDLSSQCDEHTFDESLALAQRL
jgi:hypothetical protein